jgi:hypothetical protein
MSAAADTVQARAEILKLARMLDRDPASLDYLQAVPLDDLRELRDQITDVLWSAGGGFVNKVAAAAKLLPTALSATIGERAFGAVFCAQLAARLEPSRAIDVAAKLPTPFLADVAVALDPRQTSAVIAGIPANRIAEITAELVHRSEYVTMGQFVGHLNDDALRAAVNVMNNAALLKVGFVLDDKAGLDRLVALLPAGRMEGIIAAAAEENLWLEALDLLAHLSADQRRQILDNPNALDEETLERIIACVVEHDMWPEAELIAAADPALQARLSAVPR